MPKRIIWRQAPARATTIPTSRFALISILFFFSGTAALIYEVLWMKELGLLFGNTAYATATTLAAFFSGLTAGGYTWGRYASRLGNPLLSYAVLEFAAALSVVGYFMILDGYHQLYPYLFAHFESSRSIFLAVKFGLAIIVLFPPAFFLGGTLPVMSQYIVRSKDHLGNRVSLLYAANTLGAALGVLLAGFYLPISFGYRNTYFFAMTLTAGAGLIALLLSRSGSAAKQAATENNSPVSSHRALPFSTMGWLAFLSGAVTLGLQVLWTRMFAQVLQNSVYTFAAILMVFLICLALGAALANRLMKTGISRSMCLFGVLSLAGLAIAITPFAFVAFTDGMQYVGAGRGWDGYITEVLAMTGLIMGPPVLILGIVFPYLLKSSEPYGDSVGSLVGRLTALNTAGSIVGSLTAGFIVLDHMGLWAGIRLASTLYFLAALYIFYQGQQRTLAPMALPMLGILMLVSILDASRLPVVQIDPVTEQESLYRLWEGSAGTVAVVRQKDQLKIKVNNHYTLGGSGSRDLEALQGYLPVLLHSSPRSVYFLGLGTGITAGAALRFPVEKVVVTELVPEVITASREFFAPYNERLFYDSRVQVIGEDGRNYLAGTSDTFDIIIADLFVPWKAGVGSLYAREHYQRVLERLNSSGFFMQWLPAYQISQNEFAVIVRTMLEVFPQVTVWRGDFSARKPIIGLLGQGNESPLEESALLFSLEEQPGAAERIPMLAHYVGNMRGVAGLFETFPINTDDKPIIEFQAPITQRLQKTDQVNWLAGDALIKFMSVVQTNSPLEDDPFLMQLASDQKSAIDAGMHLHRAQVLKQQGLLSAAEKQLKRYQARLDE